MNMSVERQGIANQPDHNMQIIIFFPIDTILQEIYYFNLK